MSKFAEMQIDGLHPSLLINRIHVPDHNVRLLLDKIRLTETGCWEWLAGRYPNGYGAVKIRAISPSRLLVHRLCYKMVHGELDEKLQLHHKVEDGCMGPICCNPDHLKPVTSKEHLTELTPTSPAYIFSRRPACSAGHIYTTKSVYPAPDGSRGCKTCRNLAAKAFRARQRGDKPMGKSGPKFKEFCKRGHPMSGDNLGFVSRGTVKDRICNACRVIRQTEYADRKSGKLG